MNMFMCVYYMCLLKYSYVYIIYIYIYIYIFIGSTFYVDAYITSLNIMKTGISHNNDNNDSDNNDNDDNNNNNVLP